MTPPTTSSSPPEDVLRDLPAELVVEDVSVIKAMADPMRVSILKALYTRAPGTSNVPPRTAREICALLGEERTTRIYHHVKLLLAAGLIQKAHSQRRGNLVEDYFAPVARVVRLSPELLHQARVGDGVWKDSICALLDTTRRDIVALNDATPLQALCFTHRELDLTPADAEALRDELTALIARYSDRADASSQLDPEATEPTRLLVVAYPSDPNAS